MAKRADPIRKTPLDILNDVRQGHREAALTGPEGALKFLERTFHSQSSLPNAVKFFAYDLLADAAHGVGDLDKVEVAVQAALKNMQAAQEHMALEFKRALPELCFLERGISARTASADFEGALALCDLAVELGLGGHYEAKRDSLEWAR